jgi:hypothetical protein
MVLVPCIRDATRPALILGVSILIAGASRPVEAQPAREPGPQSLAELTFTQDAEGLKIQLPQQDPGNGPYALRIASLKLD